MTFSPLLKRGLLSLMLCLTLVNGFKFTLLDEEIPTRQALVPCTPRPMFSKGDAPFSLFGEVEPTIRLIAKAKTSDSEEKMFLLLVHLVSDYSLPTLGTSRWVMDYEFGFCTNWERNMSSAVELPVITDANGNTVENVLSYAESVAVPFTLAGSTYLVNQTLPVTVTGYHYALIANCYDNSVITITSGSLDFKNPHGYLPGGWYLKLPLTGVIVLAYICLTLIFIIRCMIYREHILYLQYGIVAVLLMGLVEQSSYYFTFLEMNDQGHVPCCPVRGDIVFCLMVSVLKRGTLVIFLLAVSLGYGTVKPTLDRRNIFSVCLVGGAYVVASLNFEYRVILDASSQQDETGNSSRTFLFSALFVSVCNVAVISWIYFSITGLIEDLKQEGQTVKLKMYQSLGRALISWVIIGFLFEVMFYMIVSDTVAMSWKYGTLPKFSWDFLFLAVVAQIAYLWFPSETTSKYAYSSQIPTTDFDEFDTGIELEESRIPGKRDEFVIGEEDDLDDDDNDDEDLDKDFMTEEEFNDFNKKKPANKVALD